MAVGWIKLHRKLTEWEWYLDKNTTRLFIHLLLKSQHDDSKYQGIIIPKGSLKTGRIQLARETGLSEQQVRSSLKKLESTNEITIKATKRYSIIAVNNWDCHQQSNQQTNQQVTNNQPTSNQQVTTCKKDKNGNNERNNFKPPSIEDARGYIVERKKMGVSEAERFCDFYASKGWMVGKNKMKDWKAAIRNWEKGNSTPKPTNKPEHVFDPAMYGED